MDIVEEIRKDRENGAKRLVSEYKAGLLTLARRFCDDASDAEELVNRTFAEVVANIERYAEQSAFFGWMCQILSNLHANDCRRKATANTVYPGNVPDVADHGGQDAIFGNLDHEALREAIEQLPQDIRKAVVLHYFMEMPVREVARVLSTPTGTIAWRLHCAREMLSAKLNAAARKPGGKALLVALVLCATAALGAAGIAISGALHLSGPVDLSGASRLSGPAGLSLESLERLEALETLDGLAAAAATDHPTTRPPDHQTTGQIAQPLNQTEDSAMNKTTRTSVLAAASLALASVASAASPTVTPVPGYEILEYLESSGTQYIDTGVVYANDTKLTQRFRVVDFAGAQMQMGALDSVSGAYHRFHWGCKGGVSTLQYNRGVGIGGNPADISAGDDGWVDVTLDATSVGASFTETGHSTIGIFGRNTSGTFTCGKFRVGQTRIWKGGDLVRLLVPARRKADSVLGLYDYCEPKFYVNEGSGEFTAGPALKLFAIAKRLPDSQQSIDLPVEASCPLPVVKYETGRTLTKDVDYTVAWTDNTRYGVGTCTVSGIGDYSDAEPASAEFLIAPQAKLPQGFQRLFYLEATGTVHYVDTDIHPTANTRITVLAQTTANANTYLVGILDTPQWRRFHLGAKWISSRHYLAGGVGSSETQYTTDNRLLVDSGWNKLTMDAYNAVLSVNDGTTYTLGTSGTLPTSSTLRIFGRMSNNSANSSANPARIADVVIYESGVKTHEFIPCRRESDGVLGLYDTVGKQFLVNSGSAEGGFLAGPELYEGSRGGLVIYLR